MKRFNPEKELRKIQHGNKNKIILFVISLLVVSVISYSFALYQVRYSKRIIYTKVSPSSSKDINILAIYLDDKTLDNFPEKGSKVVFDRVECDNDSTAVFNTHTWQLILTANGKDKCSVYFKTTTDYIDDSGANPPELYQGLIPVTFDAAGKIHIADLTSDWYDYDDHRWANAVLVDYSNEEIKTKYFNEDKSLKTDIFGDEIPMDEILQMYVWIPRYKYQLFNVDNQGVDPQEIKIEFESGILSTGTVKCEISDKGVESCNNAIKGEWFTHPAFTFGNTELKGIWVGKFESSDPNDAIGRNETINEVTILPNKTSIVNKTVQIIFDVFRKMELEKNKYNLNSSEIDTHLMKNTEWGAVVYLTQSIYGIYTNNGEGCIIDGMTRDNCEVWINNVTQGMVTGGAWSYGGTYTGCVGESVNAAVKYNTEAGTVAKCDLDKVWTKKGVNASTTGNMYGIYDMSGGTSEYVMGVLFNPETSKPYYNDSGFNIENMPEAKYYDLYDFSAIATTHERGHLGDATRETLKIFGNATGGWNMDYSELPGNFGYKEPWFQRGGGYYLKTSAGIFSFNAHTGGIDDSASYRSVLTAQDGED